MYEKINQARIHIQIYLIGHLHCLLINSDFCVHCVMRENFHHLCVCYLSPTCRVLALISLCGCSYWWQISTNYLPTDVIKGRTRSFSIVIKAVLFRKPRFLLPALCFHFSSSHKNSLLKTYLALKCETKMSRTFTLGFEKEKIMHVFHLK